MIGHLIFTCSKRFRIIVSKLDIDDDFEIYGKFWFDDNYCINVVNLQTYEYTIIK